MRKSKFKDGDRMDCKEIREMYKLMFTEYPDIERSRICKPCWASAAMRPMTCWGRAKLAASGWQTPTKSPKSMSLTMF